MSTFHSYLSVLQFKISGLKMWTVLPEISVCSEKLGSLGNVVSGRNLELYHCHKNILVF